MKGEFNVVPGWGRDLYKKKKKEYEYFSSENLLLDLPF